MSTVTSAFAKVYVGPATTSTGSNVVADYTAVGVTWTEVGSVQDLGKFGGDSKEVSYTTLADAETYRLKGTKDSGSFELVVARDPDDDGQAILRTAYADEYAPRRFKVELADMPAGGTSNTVFYFKAIVQSVQADLGDGSKVITDTYKVGISGAILEVPAA